MTIPVVCDINGGKPISIGLHPAAELSGHLEVVWDYKREKADDIVGFELSIDFVGKNKEIPLAERDSISFTTGFNSQGRSIFTIVEGILGQSLTDLANDACEIQPPIDGEIEDQIAYTKNWEEFYPERPRG